MVREGLLTLAIAGTLTAQARPNRAPTVVAMCDPCTVTAGRSSVLSSDARDPDGDPLIYEWSAPSGTFASAHDRQTIWTAPLVPGTVTITLQIDDGHGATASAQVAVQVIERRVALPTFDEVHFDFNAARLRPDAIPVLDAVVTTLQANPALHLQIDGHTCDLGPAAYNLALGDARARAVRDYLVGHGIARDRLHVTSYGASRPKYDNANPSLRPLNRRVELTVQ